MEHPAIEESLVDVLVKIPALQNKTNRDALLFRLEDIGVSISRSDVPITDIISIVSSLAAMGQFVSGTWPLAILMHNAQRYCPANTTLGRELQELLNKYELSFEKQELPPLPEVLIGVDERLPVSFFEKALVAQKSVSRLQVPRIRSGQRIGEPPESVVGTAWIIGPNMIMTNFHVIAGRYPGEKPPSNSDLQLQVQGALAWFGYNTWGCAHTDYCCHKIIQTSEDLDYALLQVNPQPTVGETPLSQWGCLSAATTQPGLEKGTRLNIIQHPRGEEKRFAIRGNYYVGGLSLATQGPRIQYLTDTEPGASGSPVFDDTWKVVAIHHAAIRVPETQFKGEVVKYNNEGIEISAILDDLNEDIRAEIINSANSPM